MLQTEANCIDNADIYASNDRLSHNIHTELLERREVNYIFDPNYTWNSGDPTTSGGTLNFKGEAFPFSGAAATNLKPAVWVRK